MGLLRVIAGLAMALFASGYYGIGMLFILGDTSLGSYGPPFAIFGMLGICAPVVLCGLHLMFFGRDRSIRSRALMVAALVAALAASIAAMLPFLLSTPHNPEAGSVIVSSVASASLFGWPLVAGLVHALLKRGNEYDRG